MIDSSFLARRSDDLAAEMADLRKTAQPGDAARFAALVTEAVDLLRQRLAIVEANSANPPPHPALN